MKRTGLVTLALIMLFGCNTEVDTSPRPEQLEVAKAFVTQVGSGAYEDAVKAFTADTVKTMSPATLAKTWEGLVDRFGALQGFDGVRASEAGEYQIIYIRGRHDHGLLDIRLPFKGGTQIAGLWFRPPDEGKKYEQLNIRILAEPEAVPAEGAQPPADGSPVPAEGSAEPTEDSVAPADAAVPPDVEPTP